MMKHKTFTYDDRTLDVVATLDGDTWRIQLFENGKPVNHVTYTVTGMTDYDARISQGMDCVSDLMKIAQTDFIRWSDWQKRQKDV